MGYTYYPIYHGPKLMKIITLLFFLSQSSHINNSSVSRHLLQDTLIETKWYRLDLCTQQGTPPTEKTRVIFINRSNARRVSMERKGVNREMMIMVMVIMAVMMMMIMIIMLVVFITIIMIVATPVQ